MTVTVNGGDAVLDGYRSDNCMGRVFHQCHRKPKIRTGILREHRQVLILTEFPVANVQACETVIPFVKGMSQVNITDNSNVKVHTMTNNAGLLAEEGSTLTTNSKTGFGSGETRLSMAPGSSCTARPTITTIFLSTAQRRLVQRPPDQSRHKQPEWCGNQQWRNGADGIGLFAE